ncbi:tRNA (uracil-5-)-methyltransferase homolog A-like isoform X1 [Mytilus galloprovincialis]|uniref:tRNA (uracil-5-)-methyltransferase homolog A-like isoform X1 n=1 Tax=Mytilus galloprovincialis TaxID=29158 RepID=UPI003F7B94D8
METENTAGKPPLAGEPLERKRKTEGEGSPPKVKCEAPEKKLKTDEEGLPPKVKCEAPEKKLKTDEEGLPPKVKCEAPEKKLKTDEEDLPPKDGATENTEEEKDASTDLYQYTKREEFTSEIFKIEITNLPRFGFKQLKKRLNGLDVKPVKVKAVDTHTFAFATFRNEEERDDAIKKIKGHVWKDRTLDAKLASAAADPFQKIRSKDNRAEKSAKQIAEELLPVGERLKNSVTPLWNVPYEEQLKTKFEEIEEALKNVATQVLKNIHFDKTNTDLKDWITAQRKLYNGKCCELLPIKPSPVKEGYRNKCEFTIGKDVNGQEKTVGFRFGMYKDGTNSVGEPYDLLIIPDTMKKVVKCFQDYIRSRPLTSYDPEHHQGYWRLLTVRSCLLGDLMLTVDFHPQQLTKTAIDEEKNKLQEFFTSGDGKGCKVSSIYWRTYSSVQTGSHEAEYEHVIGSKYIEEKLFDLKFRVSPDAFFQVNTLGAEVLYSQVADWCNASPTTTVLDICCGTGTIGISMANKVDQVIGIELCEQAVEDAKQNAKLNGIYNCRYQCGKAEDLITRVMKSLHTKDVVAILDPPRAGIHPKVIHAIRKCPVLTKLIYVSCSPRSATNNFVDLMKNPSKKTKGMPYKPVKAIPVDLFPYTKHCEMVILFERKLPEPEADDSS